MLRLIRRGLACAACLQGAKGQTMHLPHSRELVSWRRRSLGFTSSHRPRTLGVAASDSRSWSPSFAMFLVARRNSDARGLRACPPSTKRQIASLRVSSREALIAHLVRPIVLDRVGRNRRHQCRKRRRCRGCNHEFPHDLSPSSFSVVHAPGCLSVARLHVVVYFLQLSRYRKFMSWQQEIYERRFRFMNASKVICPKAPPRREIDRQLRVPLRLLLE